MSTSYEAIKSLIGLLVKKAGFDVDKNYSEEELRKTKDTIKNIENDNSSELTKEQKNQLLSNLKIRQKNWESNAEVVGKWLLDSYKSGKKLSSVQPKIDMLASLASEESSFIKDTSLMGFLYEKIKTMEEGSKEITNRLEVNDYVDSVEKEMDLKLVSHLDEKVESYNREIKAIDEELERLRVIEQNDVSIVEKLKSYIASVIKDVESLEKVKKASLDKSITIETWEKIESIEIEIRSKLEKANSIMAKTQEMLENVRNNRKGYLNNKKLLEDEIRKCKDKKLEITDKINNDDYLDYTKKISDVNEKEIVRIELEKLKNKKEVVYVDVGKVKEELIKEWNKGIQETKTEVEEPEKDDGNEGKDVQPKTEVVEKIEELKVDEVIEEMAEEKVEVNKKVSKVLEEIHDETKDEQVIEEVIDNLKKTEAIMEKEENPSKVIKEEKTINVKNKIELDW